jgi:hypothetical protein
MRLLDARLEEVGGLEKNGGEYSRVQASEEVYYIDVSKYLLRMAIGTKALSTLTIRRRALSAI